MSSKISPDFTVCQHVQSRPPLATGVTRKRVQEVNRKRSCYGSHQQGSTQAMALKVRLLHIHALYLCYVFCPENVAQQPCPCSARSVVQISYHVHVCTQNMSPFPAKYEELARISCNVQTSKSYTQAATCPRKNCWISLLPARQALSASQCGKLAQSPPVHRIQPTKALLTLSLDMFFIECTSK